MRAILAVCGGFGALAVAAACASAPAQPRAVDPVGFFDFETAVEGQAVTGTVEIQRGDNGLGGMLYTNMTEPIPISSVMVDGQQITVTAQAPDSPINFVMMFTGDAFTGTWSYAGMSGTMTGRRRAASS